VEPHAIVAALAAMTDDEVAETLAAARGEAAEPADPKEKAAQALRRHRGLDRTTRATKDDAAAALLRWRSGN
jgi:hypothetical protein